MTAPHPPGGDPRRQADPAGDRARGESGAPADRQTDDRAVLVQHLRELVEALDRRLPHLERSGEAAIAEAAAVLRTEALTRLASLDPTPED